MLCQTRPATVVKITAKKKKHVHVLEYQMKKLQKQGRVVSLRLQKGYTGKLLYDKVH